MVVSDLDKYKEKKCTLKCHWWRSRPKSGFQNVLFDCMDEKHLWCCRFAFLPLLELLPCVQVIIERKKHLKTISFRDTGPHSTSPQNEPHWNALLKYHYMFVLAHVSSKAVLMALVVTLHIFTLYVCGGGTIFISGFCFLLNCKCLEPRLGSWLKFLVGKMSSVWQRQI